MITETLERRVRVIPATRTTGTAQAAGEKKRVAAYCRVSTDSEEQLNSYEAQKGYYLQKIEETPDWEMAGLYADEGISGTSRKKRTEFNKMLTACKRGRIDMIITKSLSRFARNTVDCLETVRMLKGLGIGVFFEKENINTLTESSEFLITLFSGFAQAESESLSKNVSWGIRKGMESGKVHLQNVMGYRKGPDGQPEIVPEEAKIVRKIYQRYLDGCSLPQIKQELEAEHILTTQACFDGRTKGSGTFFGTKSTLGMPCCKKPISQTASASGSSKIVGNCLCTMWRTTTRRSSREKSLLRCRKK